jgi:hypothetical protein
MEVLSFNSLCTKPIYSRIDSLQGDIQGFLAHGFSKGRYIPTRQRSHRSSHVMPHRIFGDVKERERGQRKRCGRVTRQPSHRLNFSSMRLLPTTV